MLGFEGGEFDALVETELQGCSVFFVTHDMEQSVSLQYSQSCKVVKSSVAYDRAESVLLRRNIIHMVTNLQLLTLFTEFIV